MRYRRAERLRVNGNAQRASSTGGDTLSYWLKTGRREINADFHRRMTRGVLQDLPLEIRGGTRCGARSSAALLHHDIVLANPFRGAWTGGVGCGHLYRCSFSPAILIIALREDEPTHH